MSEREKQHSKIEHLKQAYVRHSTASVEANFGKLFSEEYPVFEEIPSDMQEEWLTRFAETWQKMKTDEPVQEKIEEIETLTSQEGELLKKELELGLPKNLIQKQEGWLLKFADLWLKCDEKPSDVPSFRRGFSDEILAEVERGKVIIGGSEKDKEMKLIPDVNPESTIIFDIDPEVAIKVMATLKGISS